LTDKLTFLQLAKKVISEEKKALTGKEIWEIAKEKGYDSLVSTKGKTPGATIHAVIVVDMRNKRSPFSRVSYRPSRFFY